MICKSQPQVRTVGAYVMEVRCGALQLRARGQARQQLDSHHGDGPLGEHLRAAKQDWGPADRHTRGAGNDSARPEGRLGGVACLARSREMPRATGGAWRSECAQRADSSGGRGARQTPPLAGREAGGRSEYGRMATGTETGGWSWQCAAVVSAACRCCRIQAQGKAAADWTAPPSAKPASSYD